MMNPSGRMCRRHARAANGAGGGGGGGGGGGMEGGALAAFSSVYKV